MRTSVLSLLALGCLALSTPASGQGAATKCKDGSTSSASGRGACSDHGGIDRSATKQAKAEGKAEQRAAVQTAKAAGTMVSCGDGSTSNPGRGASHHGGVRVGGVPAGISAPKSAMIGAAAGEILGTVVGGGSRPIGSGLRPWATVGQPGIGSRAVRLPNRIAA